MATSKTYTIDPVNIDSLEQEVNDETISVGLIGSTAVGDQVTIYFDGELTAGDITALDAVAVAHDGSGGKPGITSVGLKDGVGVPATVTDCASIFVDIADGDLKIKFGDGTVKTITTDS